MMPEWMKEWGPFACLAFFVIWQLFQERRVRNAREETPTAAPVPVTPPVTHTQLDPEIDRMIRDLHRMHSVTGDDGVPAWYFPKKMEEHVSSLGKGVEGLTKSIERLDNDVS